MLVSRSSFKCQWFHTAFQSSSIRDLTDRYTVYFPLSNRSQEMCQPPVAQTDSKHNFWVTLHKLDLSFLALYTVNAWTVNPTEFSSKLLVSTRYTQDQVTGNGPTSRPFSRKALLQPKSSATMVMRNHWRWWKFSRKTMDSKVNLRCLYYGWSTYPP